MTFQYASGAFGRQRRTGLSGGTIGWMVGLALLAMLVLAVLEPIMILGNTASGQGNAWRQGLYLGVALTALVGIRPDQDRNRAMVVPIGLLLALAWAAITEIWSVAPGIGMRRLVLTALIMWTLCASTRAAGYAATLATLRIFLPLVMIANYLTVIFLPDIGIHHADRITDDFSLAGSWCGMLLHKNYAGPFCAMTILVFFFDAKTIKRYIRLAVIIPTGYFLYKTGSRDSMYSLAIAGAIGGLFHFYDPKYRSFAIILLASGVAIALIFAYYFVDPDTLTTSNHQLLSGREQIWRVVVGYIRDHGLLGAGYGSFWDVGPQSPSLFYARGWVRGVAEAHNGYLDLVGSIGLPGLLLVIMGAVVEPVLRLLISRVSNLNRGALLLAMLSFGVFHNNAESTLFDRDGSSWVFMLIAMALIARQTPDVFWLGNDTMAAARGRALFALANRSRRRRSVPDI